MRALADAGERFVVDVHRDQRIYTQDPKPRAPESPLGRRRRRVAQVAPLRVDAWMEQQPESAWQQVWIRHTTKGELRLELLQEQIWLWDGKEDTARCWQVMATRLPNDPESLKYSLSNAAPELPGRRIAQIQRQRYWMERASQEAKGEAGMADYQARGWKAWHHHMPWS